MGWPTTPFVAEFQTALDKLDKGQTSKLIKTPYGWHIITVTDTRKESQQKLEEVHDQIEQILVQQRRADAYSGVPRQAAQEGAKIEILLPELKASTAAGSKETTSK